MADYNSDRTGANIDATLDKVDALVDSGNNVTADGLVIEGDSTLVSYINNTTNTEGYHGLKVNTASTSAGTYPLYVRSDNKDRFRVLGNGDISFYEDTGTTAKMVWDASAESLGIGTASPSAPLDLNRTATDGVIANFRKDGETVGSIGASSNNLFINPTNGGILQVGGVDIFRWDSNQFFPHVDNARDLGFSAFRWDDIYATNGTINTSDRNEKQDIEVLGEAEQRVAQACKGLLRKFRWKDSVEEKDDDARIHFGIIAQDLQYAFTAEGLDAGRYAMLISTTWTDEETGEERTRLGVRYSELLAFIISAL